MKFVSREDSGADPQRLRPKMDFGFEKIHNYVIVIQTIDDLDNTMQVLSSANSWNPAAKFLISVVGFQNRMRATLRAVVQVMWKYFAINLIVTSHVGVR